MTTLTTTSASCGKHNKFGAHEFRSKRSIFATDVAGIYKGDPKTNRNAVLLENINLNETDGVLARMGKSQAADASGGMKAKLQTLALCRKQIEQGLEVGIISMMEHGNLAAFVSGKSIESTRVSVRQPNREMSS